MDAAHLKTEERRAALGSIMPWARWGIANIGALQTALSELSATAADGLSLEDRWNHIDAAARAILPALASFPKNADGSLLLSHPLSATPASDADIDALLELEVAAINSNPEACSRMLGAQPVGRNGEIIGKLITGLPAILSFIKELLPIIQGLFPKPATT